jgi:hypothetical protein
MRQLIGRESATKVAASAWRKKDSQLISKQFAGIGPTACGRTLILGGAALSALRLLLSHHHHTL